MLKIETLKPFTPLIFFSSLCSESSVLFSSGADGYDFRVGEVK